MNSEKVKEIKKALECCIKIGNAEYTIREQANACLEECPYGNRCKSEFAKDALDYINELESEKERLLEQRNKTYNIWVKDTEKLKDRIAELEKEKTCVWEEWTDGDQSVWCCSNCKEDFCFMEGDVYENNYGYCPHCGAKITALKELKEDDIDETLKEFTEANND